MDWHITDIENITEDKAKEMALETIEYKGYNVYFVRFEGGFGYSRVVFKNDHHIYYANDYELHYNNKTEEQLHKIFLKGMKEKLYEEKDMEKVKDYRDYEAKDHWVRNYLPMERDYLSMFHIITNDEEEKKFDKYQKENYPCVNPVGFCWHKAEDKDFAQYCVNLHVKLMGAKEKACDNEKYMVKAFSHEMQNHEYIINWQADYDVCSCFGKCEFDEDKSYVEYLKEMGKEHWIPYFRKAKAEYMELAEKNGWY